MLTAECQLVLFALEEGTLGFQAQCHQREKEHPSDDAKSEGPDKPDWAKRRSQPCSSENFKALFVSCYIIVMQFLPLSVGFVCPSIRFTLAASS